MAYPQPSSEVAASNGADWFRIKTPIVSAGDIYESRQGGVFSIGPESDFSRVNIAYYDANETSTFLQTTQIEVGAPSPVMQPRLDQTYLPSKKQGKLLLWPDQHWFNNYIPSSMPVGSELIRITPVLDVVQNFAGVLPVTKRNDKTYDIPFNAALVNNVYLVVPYYGRRSMNCNLYYDTSLGIVDVDYDIFGVEYRPSASGGWSVGAAELQLPGIPAAGKTWSNTLASGASIPLRLSNAQGRYDALVFVLNVPDTGGGFFGMRITVSDDE